MSLILTVIHLEVGSPSYETQEYMIPKLKVPSRESALYDKWKSIPIAAVLTLDTKLVAQLTSLRCDGSYAITKYTEKAAYRHLEQKEALQMLTSEEEASATESEHDYEEAKFRAHLRKEDIRLAAMWKKQKDTDSILIDDPTLQMEDMLDRASTTITNKEHVQARANIDRIYEAHRQRLAQDAIALAHKLRCRGRRESGDGISRRSKPHDTGMLCFPPTVCQMLKYRPLKIDTEKDRE